MTEKWLLQASHSLGLATSEEFLEIFAAQKSLGRGSLETGFARALRALARPGPVKFLRNLRERRRKIPSEFSRNFLRKFRKKIASLQEVSYFGAFFRDFFVKKSRKIVGAVEFRFAKFSKRFFSDFWSFEFLWGFFRVSIDEKSLQILGHFTVWNSGISKFMTLRHLVFEKFQFTYVNWNFSKTRCRKVMTSEILEFQTDKLALQYQWALAFARARMAHTRFSLIWEKLLKTVVAQQVFGALLI